MSSPAERVEAAIKDLQLGKMIILTDDPIVKMKAI